MLTNDTTLLAELSVLEAVDAEVPVSVSCPTCRSGIPSFPESLRKEVVDVEL